MSISMNNFLVIWACTLSVLSVLGAGCYFLLKYVEKEDDTIFDWMWAEYEAGNLEFEELLYKINLQ